MTTGLNREIDAIWRIDGAKIIGAVTRIVGDIGIAEEIAHDALVIALERWPSAGIPEKPGAWLMTAARHRAIDHLRRMSRRDRKHEELGAERALRGVDAPGEDTVMDDEIGDDVLRLMFMACHPVLSAEARVALTLRVLGGLTTDEIARAFLVPEPTIAQRIVRAKRTLRQAHVPFEVPCPEERAGRLASVLEVLYLVFNEGYAATSGDTWVRPALCEEAVRLGRILAELVPTETEVHGLVALMEIQSSRLRARTGSDGQPILLLDQDRSRWDWLLVGRGLAALERAHAPGGDLGSYALQAEIAACHARARTAGETDWARIAALYEVLARRFPSPVVELNRAMAVAMAFGPQEGLRLVDALAGEPALQGYSPLPSARGDLLSRLRRLSEARAEFERAAALTRNTPEREVLLARARACDEAAASS